MKCEMAHYHGRIQKHLVARIIPSVAFADPLGASGMMDLPSARHLVGYAASAAMSRVVKVAGAEHYGIFAVDDSRGFGEFGGICPRFVANGDDAVPAFDGI